MRFWRRRLRVGVYVDGFNVYYGARDHCGRGTAGWRWLDLVGLSAAVIQHRRWRRVEISKLVYCTAMRSREGDATSLADQEAYIRALQADARVEVLLGKYNPKRSKGLLATNKARGQLVEHPGDAHIPAWLPAGSLVDAEGQRRVVVTISTFEEKGSDVNLGTQMLVDVLERKVDAVIVVSNDADVAYPVQIARERVMVGLVNPTKRPTAAALKAEPEVGVGGHWWRRLKADDFRAHQLPETGAAVRPPDW